VHVALSEEYIVGVAGIDVGDTPLIPQYIDRSIQTVQFEIAV
jgi:hypothetical protein